MKLIRANVNIFFKVPDDYVSDESEYIETLDAALVVDKDLISNVIEDWETIEVVELNDNVVIEGGSVWNCK